MSSNEGNRGKCHFMEQGTTKMIYFVLGEHGNHCHFSEQYFEQGETASYLMGWPIKNCP